MSIGLVAGHAAWFQRDDEDVQSRSLIKRRQKFLSGAGVRELDALALLDAGNDTLLVGADRIGRENISDANLQRLSDARQRTYRSRGETALVRLIPRPSMRGKINKALLAGMVTETILPRWAGRCGEACVAEWNETVGKALGFTAKAQ